MDSLVIENHGPLMLRTNFWGSEIERAGKLYVSINAGAFRLLVPRSQEPILSDLRTGKSVVISRGPWPWAGLADALEILFDDGTETPFALHLSPESFDRLPLDSDAGREWLFAVWTAPRRGRPHKAIERPAFYRRVPQIPWLKPL